MTVMTRREPTVMQPQTTGSSSAHFYAPGGKASIRNVWGCRASVGGERPVCAAKRWRCWRKLA
ncbi:Uncharacterised protein [Citrobacter koseri]|uniref:Uncharacterized protein n=1 Tax=Citrobacter koseri TaxID=545 RepID=A0A2X2X640_CITKO|nr:Uncharacterised protein [Citrobacter koseri]